ncbi:hypothetical protein [Oscillatoria salina]|uniref:hypothetical protein n=1 Tax=Oscillatoria salina TaxID=331517 RepID=UPI0013BB66D8|nr:hypothetical protein [Oscillatoria salina]MBZ8182747.1 hypothetical protein [Oscillatoria salina IIICB1]NET91445.1 hypothetical protein [Kamptonema sp. SIO1D9]
MKLIQIEELFYHLIYFYANEPLALCEPLDRGLKSFQNFMEKELKKKLILD